MTHANVHPSSSPPPRLASQVMAELNRIHPSELTAGEGVEELERVAEALEELRGLKSTRRDTQGLMSSLPILAVAFGRKHGIKVNIGGNTACTDGERIQLPSLPMDAPHVLRAMVLGYLYHETGHIETTAMSVFKKVANESPLLKNLLNVIEDIRMEAWRNAKYPGSAAVLRDLTAIIQASGLFGTPESIAQAEPSQVLAMSILTALRSQELDQPVQAIASLWKERFIETFGEALALKIDAVTAGAAQLKDTGAALKMARKVAQVLKEEEERQEQERQQQNEQSQESEKGDSEDSSSESSPDTEANDEQSDDDSDGSESKGEQSDDEQSDDDSDDSESEDDQSKGKQSDDGEPENGESEAQAGSGGPSTTPEQHEALKEATAGDDDAFGKTDLGDIMKDLLEDAAEEAVAKECQEGHGMPMTTPDRVEVGGNAGFNELAIVAEASQKLRIRLAAKLQADARRKRTHVDKGQRLDGQVLHRLFINDPRVFLRKENKHDVNTAVQILLDRSGSMSGRKIEIARQATLAVALGLGQIPRVKAAASAFPDVVILKQWDERVQQVANRFPITVAGSTPMAQAMLWGSANLASRREERKLMIVITDGAPDNTAQVQTMVKALTRSKVECIGVGIGCDAVRHLFPQWVVINSVDELAPALFDVVGKSLSGGRRAA